MTAYSPIARTDDPESSYIAAARVTESGTRAVHKIAVMDALRSLPPGATAHELAEWLEATPIRLSRVEVNRRLPDLRREGKVRNGESRQCGCDQRPCQKVLTWWLV